MLKLQMRSYWVSWGLHEMERLKNKLGNLRGSPKAVERPNSHWNQQKICKQIIL